MPVAIESMMSLAYHVAVNIIEGHFERQVDDVRAIFQEYADSLGFHLCFQDFERELAELPGAYAPPAGRLLLGVDDDDRICGCVALREFGPGVCEMKRLYVRPPFRGTGLGKVLATRVVDEACRIGYQRMCLDTMPSMTAAVAVYEKLGFVEVEPYRYNPIEGARFMELLLTPDGCD